MGTRNYLVPCNGVFTDQFIFFRPNFPQSLNIE